LPYANIAPGDNAGIGTFFVPTSLPGSS
jgi:hypothetical protein